MRLCAKDRSATYGKLHTQSALVPHPCRHSQNTPLSDCRSSRWLAASNRLERLGAHKCRAGFRAGQLRNDEKNSKDLNPTTRTRRTVERFALIDKPRASIVRGDPASPSGEQSITKALTAWLVWPCELARGSLTGIRCYLVLYQIPGRSRQETRRLQVDQRTIVSYLRLHWYPTNRSKTWLHSREAHSRKPSGHLYLSVDVACGEPHQQSRHANRAVIAMARRCRACHPHIKRQASHRRSIEGNPRIVHQPGTERIMTKRPPEIEHTRPVRLERLPGSRSITRA
jgi:hypothetical protein